MGLRYSPELRFYKDNTHELQMEQKTQALEYMKEQAETRMSKPIN